MPTLADYKKKPPPTGKPSLSGKPPPTGKPHAPKQLPSKGKPAGKPRVGRTGGDGTSSAGKSPAPRTGKPGRDRKLGGTKKKAPPPKDSQDKARAERKLSRPHSELVGSLVLKWNELRERKTPLERRQQLIAEVVAAVKGKVMSIILRHDASRVVQGCIKYGSVEQKRAICQELFGHVLDLAKSKHGYHIAERMLRYGGAPVRDRVLAELKGSIGRLLTHNLGSVVVQAGFLHGWTPAQAWGAYQELYGPEYVYFKADDAAAAAAASATGVNPRSLAAVLAAHPEKRRAVLSAMFYTLSKQADKGLLSLPVAQKLLLEYLLHAPPEQVTNMVGIVRSQVLALLATREGARAAALCFAYGVPKERKYMLRTLKGHMLDIASHDHGHMVLVAALAFTDDTRTSGSLVFDELRPHLAYLACHRYGRKVLLALLAPRDPRYFAPVDLGMLAPVSLPAYLAARKVTTPAAPGDAPEGEGAAVVAAAVAGKGKGKDAAVAAADAAAADEDAGAAAAGEPGAAAGPRRHLLPLEPTPEQQRDAALMAPTPTSKKPEAIKARELLAAPQLRRDLEGVLLTRTSLLARSAVAAPVLQEAAVRLGSAELWAAIADLAVDEPSPAVLASQVDEMNAAARTASYAAQSRVRRSGAMAATAASSAVAPAAAVAATPAARVTFGGPAAMDDGGSDGGDVGASRGSRMVDEGGDEGEEEEDEEDEGDDDDDDEDEDEEEEDESGDDEGGGRGVIEKAAAPASRLPIFEDPSSHLLFKRLLQRESVTREESGGGTTGGGSAAGAKRRRDSGAGGSDAAGTVAGPADAVLGRLLLQRLAGSLAAVASSNRACLVLAELLRSSDSAVAAAVHSELAAQRAVLAAQPDCAGKEVLLRALAEAGASEPPATTGKPAKPRPAGAGAGADSAPPAQPADGKRTRNAAAAAVAPAASSAAPAVAPIASGAARPASAKSRK